jgi:hypothetical protein
MRQNAQNPTEDIIERALLGPPAQPAGTPMMGKVIIVHDNPSRSGAVWAEMVSVGELNGQAVPIQRIEIIALDCCGSPLKNPYAYFRCGCGCRSRVSTCCEARCSLCGMRALARHLVVNRETLERYCVHCA